MSRNDDHRPALDSPLHADADDLVPHAAVAGDSANGDGGPAEPAGWQAEPAATGITLSLDDLLPADDGSVIFDADVGVTLTDTGAVAASGVAPPEARAGGMDVGGYQFVTLESGLTLYYPSDASLILPIG
jgi:hypothetical protein